MVFLQIVAPGANVVRISPIPVSHMDNNYETVELARLQAEIINPR